MEIKALRPTTLSPRPLAGPRVHNSGAAAKAVRRPRDRLKMMISRLALRGASRVPTRSMVDDAAMRERERCWAAWANADTLHLNYMRNSLLATSVGLTMIHFRREIEERPPLGGLVMTALGLGYAFAGGACHLYAVARLRSSLLSPLGTFAACAHAVAPPFMLSTAALCFLDRSPTWVKDLGIAVPATGLWRPRAQPVVEVKPRRWYSHFQGEKKPRPPAKRSYWPLDQHNSKTD